MLNVAKKKAQRYICLRRAYITKVNETWQVLKGYQHNKLPLVFGIYEMEGFLSVKGQTSSSMEATMALEVPR